MAEDSSGINWLKDAELPLEVTMARMYYRTVTSLHFLMESTSHKASANQVQGMLRLKDNHQAIGPLRPARTPDALILEKIAKNIAQGTASSQQLLLTTGFGLHRNLKIPVRLPTLAIPGLNVMERMKDAGLPVPTYLLYQATDFIAETNYLPADASRECSEKMERYLRRYVEKFHSRIAEHVLFRFGCEYPPELKEAITLTTQDIRSRLAEIGPIREAMQQINGYEARHSNGSNHYDVYAAANVLYSGAAGEYPFVADLPPNVEAILPIGGNAEKPFFALTAHMAEQVGKRKVIPMLTPLGSRPTYYHYPQSGDPVSIAEYDAAMKEQLKDGPIRADINAMAADGATPEALAEIYPEEQ